MTAPPIDACSPTTVRLGERTLTSFGGCNYLGLAQHPRVLRAAAEAMARFGLSTSASRETTGNTRLHAELELRLAIFCGHPAALLVPDGYIANLAAMQALAASGVRSAVIDTRAHASLRDAAVMAGLTVRGFAHLDAADARRMLNADFGPAVLATDSVFAADGAIAPATDLLAALRPGDRLLLDDCHGLAVLGRQGRGLADHLRLASPALLVTTTLAKGLGCAGGVVMGDADLIDTARAHSTAYICTTPASPVLVGAAIEALAVLADEPGLHERLAANTRAVRRLLAPRFGVAPDHPVPIIAFTTGTPQEMHRLRAAADQAGLITPLVSYPGGPSPLYFRLSVSSAHTHEQITMLAHALQVAPDRTEDHP
jgi:8-amino-7-oxononanoate synthase